MSDREEKERLEMVAKRAHFENLYFKWLEARAQECDPCCDEGDDVLEVRALATDEAARQLLVFPAFLDWMIWKKWEVLELYMARTRLTAATSTTAPSWRSAASRRT